MTERLLTFLFLGILLALGYHLGADLIYARYFAASTLFARFWYLPYAALPSALLLGLAYGLGFFRNWGWADIAALAVAAALTFLTIPASYTCGGGCF